MMCLYSVIELVISYVWFYLHRLTSYLGRSNTDIGCTDSWEYVSNIAVAWGCDRFIAIIVVDRFEAISPFIWHLSLLWLTMIL